MVKKKATKTTETGDVLVDGINKKYGSIIESGTKVLETLDTGTVPVTPGGSTPSSIWAGIVPRVVSSVLAMSAMTPTPMLDRSVTPNFAGSKARISSPPVAGPPSPLSSAPASTDDTSPISGPHIRSTIRAMAPPL